MVTSALELAGPAAQRGGGKQETVWRGEDEAQTRVWGHNPLVLFNFSAQVLRCSEAASQVVGCPRRAVCGGGGQASKQNHASHRQVRLTWAAKLDGLAGHPPLRAYNCLLNHQHWLTWAAKLDGLGDAAHVVARLHHVNLHKARNTRRQEWLEERVRTLTMFCRAPASCQAAQGKGQPRRRSRQCRAHDLQKCASTHTTNTNGNPDGAGMRID